MRHKLLKPTEQILRAAQGWVEAPVLRKVGGEGITEEEVAASDGNTLGHFVFFIGDIKTCMSFFFSLFKKYLFGCTGS